MKKCCNTTQGPTVLAAKSFSVSSRNNVDDKLRAYGSLGAHLDVVLRKLIPKLQAFSKSI
jgi:hypothetical protein